MSKEIIKYKIKKGKYPADPNVVADVYFNCNMIVKKCCEVFGVAERTFYDWLKKPEVVSLVEVRIEIMVDKAKRNVEEMLDCSDLKLRWDASKFVLKTKGGYSETTKVEHTGTVEHQHVKINYILPETPQIIEAEIIEPEKNNDMD